MYVNVKKEFLSDILDTLNSYNIKVNVQTINEKEVLLIDDLDFTLFDKIIDKEKIISVESSLNLKLVTRINHVDDTIINVNGNLIGGKEKVIIAGSCAIEKEEDFLDLVKSLKTLGIKFVRAGIFKPRTNPYSYQGLGIKGISILKKAREMYGVNIVSEITDTKYLKEFEEAVDIIQVGARNMQNFELLKALGKSKKPILLKRGFNNSIEELLCAAEYIMLSGNKNVILCERGIRTPLSYTRNTLDICAIVALKELTHLPVIADPSHASGKRALVVPLSLAALTSGADGLIIECDKHPNEVISDSDQCISLLDLEKIIHSLGK